MIKDDRQSLFNEKKSGDHDKFRINWMMKNQNPHVRNQLVVFLAYKMRLTNRDKYNIGQTT
jgi:hypothetical protein